MDASRITLAGDSAGGHLALVTALRLKAAGTWQPAQLILIYPMLDATASMASYVSGPHEAVLFDAQFSVKDGEKLVEMIRKNGKPL
ncbi:alpha/beta hydrolase fold domain-containing protein, partial [Klebsiella pneumoniae]|uniref:alpha/beta hydrolase fold domain-containing protein n=1 Tax=Klebsiella pneumoniae TaxID=573 RepID=UPI003F7E103E